MSATRTGELLRRLHPADDDGRLLARFAADRDPAAFAALVRRHGPLVLGVCRRVTGHPQDAEDAFQAVFLVLAKKAGGLRDPGRLGNWLYGVAAKVASRARRAAARRRVREVQAVDAPDPPAPEYSPPADIGPALHEELAALPAHYREPIVLCDLQGVSRAEAARALGVPEGTLSSRLANGRKKLADRLTRRGVALSALGVPGALADGRAAVPDALVSNTCGVVAAWAAGGAVPAAVVRLAAGGFPVKSVMLGGVLALSLVAGAVIAGAVPTRPRPDAPPAADPPRLLAIVSEVGGEEQPPKAKAGAVGAPRLREALDLPVRYAQRVVWSPAGDRLVVVAAPKGDPVAVLFVVKTTRLEAPELGGFVNVASPQQFVGFTPDGKHVVTAQREQKLVSGKHRVAVWALGAAGGIGIGAPGGGEGGGGGLGPIGGAGSGDGGVGSPAGPGMPALQLKKSFNIDPEQGSDYVFAADGKSYRTLVFDRDDVAIRKVHIRTVAVDSGKMTADVGALSNTYSSARLTPDGAKVVTVNAASGEVGLYTIGGDPAWSVAPDLGAVAWGAGPTGRFAFPSANGNRVFVTHGVCRPVVLDGETGKALPKLEGADPIDAGEPVFTADGRIVAVPYVRIEKKEERGKNGEPGPVRYSRVENRLGVWDTTTGKLVRSWPGRVTAVAFHPTRPVLAVLELNGEQTRLGLWDFTAE